MSSVEEACQELFSLISAQWTLARDAYTRAATTREEAYRFPPKPALFLSLAHQTEGIQAHVRLARELTAMLDQLLDSERLHDKGESCFFAERYKEAEEFFHEAEDKVGECQQVFDTSEAAGTLPASLRDLLRGLVVYYQVQVVECQAFLHQRNGEWTAAQSHLAHEIRLSEAGKQIVGGVSPALGRWFEGHVWYAEKRQYECLASLSEQAGDMTARDEYLSKAREANLKSHAANTQFTGYE